MTNLSLARVLSGGMTAVHPNVHTRDRARGCDAAMIDRWDGGRGRKHHLVPVPCNPWQTLGNAPSIEAQVLRVALRCW